VDLELHSFVTPELDVGKW